MSFHTPDPDAVTVGVAARRAGVTVRTLHHWDRIGLARPSARSAAGYRLYSEEDVDRVHRIVAYQRAGLGLDAIGELLDRPAGQIGAALGEQRRMLARRIAELRDLDAQLGRMEAAHERGIVLSAADQAAVFGEDWDAARTAQARERWGANLQWAQFAERSAARSRDEWAALAEQMRDLEQRFAGAMDDGGAPDSLQARALVEQHREVFSRFFPISREMQVCLGRMFAADPGFAAHYDGIRPGLAGWLHRAIDSSAAVHGIDPDTAAWR